MRQGGGFVSTLFSEARPHPRSCSDRLTQADDECADAVASFAFQLGIRPQLDIGVHVHLSLLRLNAVEGGLLRPFSSTSLLKAVIVKMNFDELISAVSAETNVPPEDVNVVASAVLEKLAQLIDAQDKFVSSVVTMQSTTASARAADGDKPARPERKIGRIKRRETKTV